MFPGSRSLPHRIIMHCDLDAFFPSCEARRDPSLAGKALIVGADPKRGRGRGVVSSCSYEARRLGVRAAMPISRAFRLCPQGTYLRPDPEFYAETSSRVMDLLRTFSDRFEQTSIDEAFLDVSNHCATFRDAQELALKMKSQLEAQEAMTMSIGIAPNKSAAKIASGIQKPAGLTVVTLEEVRSFLETLPVERISGVGVKTAKLLGEMGIKTIGQLSQVPPESLTKSFGKIGAWLWSVSCGSENTPVTPRLLQKSVSVEQTFERDVQNKTLVRKALETIAEQAHTRLVSEGLLFRTVAIKIRFADFDTYLREKTRPVHTDDLSLVVKCVRALFGEFERNEEKVRLVGIRLSGLKPAGDRQQKFGWSENRINANRS